MTIISLTIHNLCMQIGIVIHNFQLIDSPQTVENILTLLSEENLIDTYLCGTMGKLAAIDAGLEGLIKVDQLMKPSACIESFFKSKDLVLLLNHGLDLKTGRTFGRIVASHLKNPEEKPLIQIERPGRPDGELIPWNQAAWFHAKKLSSLLNMEISAPPLPVNTIEVTNQGRQVIRKVETFPGANIMVEGIVVGKATSSEVALIAENGFLTSMEGGVIKEQGVEILHKYEERVPIDLSMAWVKTGTSLKYAGIFKGFMKDKIDGIEKKTPLNKRFLQGERPEREGKVILVDHCAERSFELIEGTSLAITVGDDTTEIAGNIFSRFGIPIFGVIDGDSDELATTVTYSPGSMVLRLKPGKDDEFGKEIKQIIFSGKQMAFFEDIEDLKPRILKLAENLLESVSEY